MFILSYLGHHPKAFIVFVIVILGAFVGFLQEWKAESIMRELGKFLIPKALVVSEGKITEIESRLKEAWDMILLDDSFSTIVKAIEEGRNVFRKIQRIIMDVAN